VGSKDEKFKPLSQIDSWQHVKCFGTISGGEPEPYRFRVSKQSRWFFSFQRRARGRGGDAGRWVEAAKEGVARKTVVDKCEHTRQVFLRCQAPPSSLGFLMGVFTTLVDRVLGLLTQLRDFFLKSSNKHLRCLLENWLQF